ncbi:MAG: hypothetical protein P8L18_14295 [Verrucomicrobiota bacterium]|nr:hypothetical protein [Verrucomicrobiota bacterium]
MGQATGVGPTRWKQMGRQSLGRAIILPQEDNYVIVGAVYSSKRKAHGFLTMESDKQEGPYKLRSEEPLMEGIDPAVVMKMRVWLEP